jgi:hypothetical protein
LVFSAADSHRRSGNIAAMLATELTCLKSNAEKIALLRRDRPGRRKRSVFYIALAQMQREQARQQHELNGEPDCMVQHPAVPPGRVAWSGLRRLFHGLHFSRFRQRGGHQVKAEYHLGLPQSIGTHYHLVATSATTTLPAARLSGQAAGAARGRLAGRKFDRSALVRHELQYGLRRNACSFVDVFGMHTDRVVTDGMIGDLL